jgi:hypothetical protein
VLAWGCLFGFVMVVRWQRRKGEFKVEVFSDLGWINRVGIGVCSNIKLMHDNNWGNIDR